MAPEDERAPQASPSPPPEPGGVSGARGDLGGGPGAGFGSGVSGGLYHERQRLELCALHALNNLLQRPWLSKAAADGICRRPLERLSVSPVLGFLLNVPSRPRLGGLRLPLARPHWLSVRHLGDSFYNLDSKLPAPASIGSETQLREFLQRVLDEGSSELFLVVPREVEEEGTWLKPE
ncbi:josephin-2-like isoform X2 [Poecile atricapillus]|uniref:josephin-2-like isoform X2 n=1 Tax=Poecile atricapillus TaxID=48891 RepID=UPI0027398AC4|nr:josephin-2-like isoform X2 [Poecile atricapillus]